MKDDLLYLALGFAVGAIWVHSNQNASKMIDDGKEKVKEAIDKI